MKDYVLEMVSDIYSYIGKDLCSLWKVFEVEEMDSEHFWKKFLSIRRYYLRLVFNSKIIIIIF